MKIWVVLLVVLSLLSVALSQEEEESPVDHILELFDLDGDANLKEEEFDEWYASLFGEATSDGHDHDHKRNIIQPLSTSQSNKRSVQQTGEEHEHGECHPAGELFHEYDMDGNELLDRAEIVNVSTAMIAMVLSECKVEALGMYSY